MEGMGHEQAGCLAGALGCGFLLVFGLIVWLLSAWILHRIGKKFGVGSFVEYLIPIYNLYLLCKCAQITPLWLIAFLVPLVNIVASVYLWGTIAARLGKEFWLWGIICALIGLPVLVIAFDDSKPVENPVLPNF